MKGPTLKFKLGTIELGALIIVALNETFLTPTPARNKPVQQAAQSDTYLLPEQSVNTLSSLKREFQEAQTERRLLVAQLARIDARIDALIAKRDLEFNRFCAKHKLDPDEWEWNEDLSGVRRKNKGE